ncbi:alpha/beta fold hydrolase [Diaminobutyricibacter sp. McL0618]|uniref:alpha/beta fold hydrolase n=1 Tax=Leifsonia sp. McL0618 TaxID=3415677 RepID=UPI003CE850B5
MNSAPHLSERAAVTIRRGSFWIEGDPTPSAFGTIQRGPMYVHWEAPADATDRPPLILVHGGGGQGTDWMTTADGRPGWLDAFVRAGYPTYVVDRPGHGRSPHHPDVLGEPGAPGGFESTIGVFANPVLAEAHTQWPWARSAEGYEIAQLAASAGFIAADFAAANDIDGRRLSELLDRTGPAVLITHSVGAVGGWLAATLNPASVLAVVAIEPMGPPFTSIPGLGSLTWGVTAVPLPTEPPILGPEELVAQRGSMTIPGLAGLPIVVVAAPASPFAGGAAPVVDFLVSTGARAELLRLEEHGVVGNGHGVMLEANSDEAIEPILVWLEEHA